MDVKKKRFTIMFVLLSIVFVMLTYASINSVKTVNNTFLPASVDVAVVENDSIASGVATVAFSVDENDESAYTADKKIQVENTGGSNPASVFVRVCIFPKFDCDIASDELQVGILTDFPSAVDADNTLKWGDVTFHLDSAWDKNWYYDGSSGYFYYIGEEAYTGSVDDEGNPITVEIDKGVLPVGYMTAPLLQSVSVDADTIKTEYKDRGALLRVSVLADSIQTVGGAVEQRWNVGVLQSNDVARPEEKTTEEEVTPALAAVDEGTSDSAAVPYFITEYEKARVEKMISRVSVTVVYSLPEETTDTPEDSDEVTNSEDDETASEAEAVSDKGESDETEEASEN